MNTFYCIGVGVNLCPCYKQIYNDNCCPVSKHLKLLSDTNILSLCLKCLFFWSFTHLHIGYFGGLSLPVTQNVDFDILKSCYID